MPAAPTAISSTEIAADGTRRMPAGPGWTSPRSRPGPRRRSRGSATAPGVRHGRRDRPEADPLRDAELARRCRPRRRRTRASGSRARRPTGRAGRGSPTRRWRSVELGPGQLGQPAVDDLERRPAGAVVEQRVGVEVDDDRAVAGEGVRGRRGRRRRRRPSRRTRRRAPGRGDPAGGRCGSWSRPKDRPNRRRATSVVPPDSAGRVGWAGDVRGAGLGGVAVPNPARGLRRRGRLGRHRAGRRDRRVRRPVARVARRRRGSPRVAAGREPAAGPRRVDRRGRRPRRSSRRASTGRCRPRSIAIG